MASNANPVEDTDPTYYAVAIGRTVGIFLQWSLAYESTDKHPNNRHRRFDTLSGATDFLASFGITDDSVKVHIDKDQVLDLRDFVSGPHHHHHHHQRGLFHQ